MYGDTPVELRLSRALPQSAGCSDSSPSTVACDCDAYNKILFIILYLKYFISNLFDIKWHYVDTGPMNNAIHSLDAIGAAIRVRRETLGLTQQRLATLADLSRVTVNELENGLLIDLGMGKVIRLLDILGFSLGLSLAQSSGEKPARNGLNIAARTASVSYRSSLPPMALAEAVRTGKIPQEFRAHIATLLDEAPIPVVVRAVEESFRSTVPKRTWRHIAKWASDFKSTRNVWH